MAVGYKNYAIKAQKAAESMARKSQNIHGYTACKRSGERSEFNELTDARNFVKQGGRVIRNSDCVVVYKV